MSDGFRKQYVWMEKWWKMEILCRRKRNIVVSFVDEQDKEKIDIFISFKSVFGGMSLFTTNFWKKSLRNLSPINSTAKGHSSDTENWISSPPTSQNFNSRRKHLNLEIYKFFCQPNKQNKKKPKKQFLQSDSRATLTLHL